MKILLDENKLIHQRREKLNEIRQQGIAFPNDFRRTAFANELHNEYDEQSKEEIEELHSIVSVVGRAIRMRGPIYGFAGWQWTNTTLSKFQKALMKIKIKKLRAGILVILLLPVVKFSKQVKVNYLSGSAKFVC